MANAGDEEARADRAHVLVVNLNRSATSQAGAKRLARTLAAMSDRVDAKVVHYKALLTAEGVALPTAVVLSPQGDPWPSYPPEDLEALGAWVRGFPGPILGVCGGHQFLALAFGGTVAPIRGKLEGTSYGGMFRERGPTAIEVERETRWFPGTKPGETITVIESHVEEVKSVPEGFDVIAKGAVSPAQAMAHRTRPILGVQFHPERATNKHPAGRQVLKAFLDQVLEATRGAEKDL